MSRHDKQKIVHRYRKTNMWPKNENETKDKKIINANKQGKTKDEQHRPHPKLNVNSDE
jgi:hypothetical protein